MTRVVTRMLEKYKDRKRQHAYEIVDISTVILPIISRLRLLGCCPLSIVKTKKSYSDCSYIQVQYSFKFFSLPTIYTFAVFIIYVLDSTWSIYEDVYQGHYQALVQNDCSCGWALDGFVSIYYLWLSINPILICVRTCSIVKFLQNVAEFSVKFEGAFTGEKADFTKAKKIITLTRICFGTLGLAFSSVIFYLYIPCLFRFEGTNLCKTAEERNQAWVAFFGVISGYTVGFYQDTFLICLFHIIENMLTEVERGISNHVTRYAVEHSDISGWAKLGRSIKLQTDLLCRIIGPWELGTLFSNFLTWILLAFMLVNALQYESIVLGSAAFFCCSNLVRLHIKTCAEQRIRYVEKRLRHLIVGLKPNDFLAETERSLLVSIMACKPIQFHLCNLITLDTSLTFWLIGGVVTYLIVLLQFQDLKTSA